MRAVVQRANGASVSVNEQVVGSFDGPGLVVLVGVTNGDSSDVARKLAIKIDGLRIFPGPDGSEVSAGDLDLPILLISQFTLYGETKNGRRPTWDRAAKGDVAQPLIDEVTANLRELGREVNTGVFGADMQVSLVNDGPFTVLLEVEGG